ncbi:RNA polymerase sigma factor [Flaviaesturariibacter aridisoli]|uniref:RNA polymerase sigma factor n=1 Tax=Flaviaesturariibacter aridisoli TaxID=2545761 RepID=UPI001FB63DFD|nr:RNA polymerase sigma factor [Flaviaesturariibacter aridisoli]
MTESDLIEGLQRLEEPAFRALVAQYGDRIYNTVLGLVQRAEDAEDLAQEVFVRVWQSVGSFKREAGLGTWIYRIAVTAALDFRRKQQRHKRGGFLVSLFSRHETEPEAPDFHHPGVAAEQKERSALLFRAIRALPEKQGAAFVLQKLEGLRQDEIAAVLDTTVSSVESLLHRAKQNLRKELAGMMG